MNVAKQKRKEITGIVRMQAAIGGMHQALFPTRGLE